MGQLQRRIAHRLELPELGTAAADGARSGRMTKCHRQALPWLSCVVLCCCPAGQWLFPMPRRRLGQKRRTILAVLMHKNFDVECPLAHCVLLQLRLPVTALALTADDTTAYSVSKDGSIVSMDVESGAW